MGWLGFGLQGSRGFIKSAWLICWGLPGHDAKTSKGSNRSRELQRHPCRKRKHVLNTDNAGACVKSLDGTLYGHGRHGQHPGLCS